MSASFSALSLESLSTVAFMLVNFSSIHSLAITDMMTAWDNSVLDCEKITFLGDSAEESLLE